MEKNSPDKNIEPPLDAEAPRRGENKSRIVNGFRLAGDICGFISGLNAHGLWEQLGRSSAMGTSTLGALLGTIIKEKPMTDEEYRRLSEMTNVQYVATKLFYAFNPRDHIRETVGLTIALTGVGLMVSGLSSDPTRYPELAIGVVAATGGGLLGLSKEASTGRSRMGTLFGYVMTPLDIMNAADGFARGDYWVTAMAACFVASVVSIKLLPEPKSLAELRQEAMSSNSKIQK